MSGQPDGYMTIPKPTDMRMLAVFDLLAPVQHDYLLIVYAADPDASLPAYDPMNDEQSACAATLLALGLLTADHHLTPIGMAAVEYALAQGHVYFVPATDTDDGDDVEPAYC
jgi:hypothetical protein